MGTFAMLREIETLKKNVIEILKEDLPKCTVNKKFIESVHMANMVDKMIARILGELKPWHWREES